MSVPYGMTPAQWFSYKRACEWADIDDPRGRITQTIGRAKASKGFHKQDGEITINGVVYKYCAALDTSIRRLKETQIRRLLEGGARYGWVGWYRYRGSFAKNRHIHWIYVNLPMKPELQRQVRDFLADRDGLAGHGPEPFWTAPPHLDNLLREAFLDANPQ